MLRKTDSSEHLQYHHYCCCCCCIKCYKLNVDSERIELDTAERALQSERLYAWLRTITLRYEHEREAEAGNFVFPKFFEVCTLSPEVTPTSIPTRRVPDRELKFQQSTLHDYHLSIFRNISTILQCPSYRLANMGRSTRSIFLSEDRPFIRMIDLGNSSFSSIFPSGFPPNIRRGNVGEC